MAQIIQTTFQFKRGDAERWNELNPILAEGEPGFELDTDKFKIGNGINTWKELPYKGEGNIVNAQTRNEFPVQGNENAIYKAQDEKLLYQWNPNASEYEVLGTFGETDDGDFITIDTELSTSSMNPVANKVIAMALQDFVKDHYTKQEVDTAIENTNKRIDLLEGTTHFRGVYPSLSDETLNTDLYEFSAGDIFIVENAEYICTTSGNLTLLEKANYEKLGDVTAEVERISALEEKVGNEENGETEATGLYQAIADLENNKLDTAALNNYYSKDETYATTEIDSLLQEIDNREEVTTLGELVDTIIGDDVGVSMRTVAVAVVAEIVGKAPEAFNTLEEIAAWIEAHPNDVTAIVKRISDLETNVGKKVDKTDIINTLDSTALDKPLSAAMGKELNSLIEELSTDVTGKVTEAQVATAISNALKAYSTTTAMQTAISTALADYAKANHNHDGVYIKQTELAGAVNTALQTAKESGDFDGTSVTISSVTESTESGGSNVVNFSDGKSLSVKNGKDGKTPVKGTDYWTNADKTEIKNYVDSNVVGKLTLGINPADGLLYIYKDGIAIGSGVEISGGEASIGYVDVATNTIIINTSLGDGSYVVQYEMEDGTTTYIGQLDIDTRARYSVTNNLIKCSNTNTVAQAIGGESYTALIKPDTGYIVDTITVTMGENNNDITDTAVEGNTISIARVDGPIVITATAVEQVVSNNPTITNNLTNCSNSNTATEVVSGSSYQATISTTSEYALSSLKVLMAGDDISDTAITNTATGATINIESVTGHVVITASAVENLIAKALDFTYANSTWTLSNNVLTDTSVTPNTIGYKTGYNTSSSTGVESAATGSEITGFIPVKYGDTIRIKNIATTENNRVNLQCYKGTTTDGVTTLTYIAAITLHAGFITRGTDEGNGVYSMELTSKHNNKLTSSTGITHMKFSSTDINNSSVITVNKKII